MRRCFRTSSNDEIWGSWFLTILPQFTAIYRTFFGVWGDRQSPPLPGGGGGLNDPSPPSQTHNNNSNNNNSSCSAQGLGTTPRITACMPPLHTQCPLTYLYPRKPFPPCPNGMPDNRRRRVPRSPRGPVFSVIWGWRRCCWGRPMPVLAPAATCLEVEACSPGHRGSATACVF